jgi:hypothetical protein
VPDGRPRALTQRNRRTYRHLTAWAPQGMETRTYCKASASGMPLAFTCGGGAESVLGAEHKKGAAMSPELWPWPQGQALQQAQQAEAQHTPHPGEP